MHHGGFTDKLVAGLEHVAARCVDSGLLCVVNVSMGRRREDPPVDMDQYGLAVRKAIKGVVAKGIVAVVAAGNHKKDSCLHQHVAEPSVIVVGATDKQDKKASFSNIGPCVNVYAPGVGIRSAGVDSPTANRLDTGTSMAAPRKFSCSHRPSKLLCFYLLTLTT